MSAHLIEPNRDLQSKGDGDRSLAMGAAEHHCISFTLSQVGCYSHCFTNSLSQDHHAVSQLQADSGVDNIVAGRSEMNAPTGVAGGFSHRLGQGHDVVFGLVFNLPHTLYGHRFGVSDGGNSLVVGFADTTQLHMCPDKGSLNFELTGVASLFRPDDFEIITAIAVV